jgi:hypothetical protein
MIDANDQKILDELNQIEDQKSLNYILDFSWTSLVIFIVFLAASLLAKF